MRITVIGAGKMAQAVVSDLVRQPEVAEVQVADLHVDTAKALRRQLGLRGALARKVLPAAVNATHLGQVRRLIRGSTCTVGATTYAHNELLTRACIAEGSHFCDLGGNNDVVAAQRKLNSAAKQAGVVVLPDCGLAPGMVNILGAHFCGSQFFDSVEHLALRVGGLPQQRDLSPMGYSIVFSVRGLINEYIEPVVVLEDGRKRTVPGMSGLETLTFPQPFGKLEAFYTSGGTSTLPRTLRGRVKHLDYKTIRYPGHAAQVQLLMDLGLCGSEPLAVPVAGKKSEIAVAPRELTERLLAKALPHNAPDVVLIRIQVTGKQGRKRLVRTYDNITTGFGEHAPKLSAMQRTTGFTVAILAHQLATGVVAKRGVLEQERAIDGARLLDDLAKRNIRFRKRERTL